MAQRISEQNNSQTEASLSHRLGAELARNAKVLIVDDEPDIVEEVVERLESEGLDCLSAYNAQSAMELVRSDDDIGVVVTDIRMPGMDGLEMARHMREDVGQGRDLFVIVVTGHAGMQEAIEALQIGAEDFLTKPISPDHLVHSVNRAEEMLAMRRNERDFQKRLEREVEEKTAALNETNRKLNAANNIKDQFLATMGHELRTPLNAINGFCELLKMNIANGDHASVIEYADYIMRSEHRLRNTIENILEFSAFIGGDRKAVFEKMVLEDLLFGIRGEFDEALKEKNMHIDIVDVPAVALVDADRLMLSRAISCIVDNAIKFSQDGTSVTISAQFSEDSVHIKIADQGFGMTDEEIIIAKRLLTQTDSSLSRPAEGSGVGLSLAILLVEKQGGNVAIESVPAQGTEVTITLPHKMDE